MFVSANENCQWDYLCYTFMIENNLLFMLLASVYIIVWHSYIQTANCCACLVSVSVYASYTSIHIWHWHSAFTQPADKFNNCILPINKWNNSEENRSIRFYFCLFKNRFRCGRLNKHNFQFTFINLSQLLLGTLPRYWRHWAWIFNTLFEITM